MLQNGELPGFGPRTLSTGKTLLLAAIVVIAAAGLGLWWMFRLVEELSPPPAP